MVLDCPALDSAAGAAISSKAEVAVQCRQARHGRGHGTRMAREVNGWSLQGSVANPGHAWFPCSLNRSPLWVSGTSNTCAGNGFEVFWQVPQWQTTP